MVRRHSGEEDGSLLDDDYDEDDSGSDFEDGLPVTGFAVASNRRQSDFHALFPGVDEGDYLIEGELRPEAGEDKLNDRRLWMCIVQGYPRSWSPLRVRKPPVLPRKHLWLGHRRESTPSVHELIASLSSPLSRSGGWRRR